MGAGHVARSSMGHAPTSQTKDPVKEKSIQAQIFASEIYQSAEI
jgi:hypothetical protein